MRQMLFLFKTFLEQKVLLGLSVLLAALTAHAEVGVSVSVGQPGFYGQIDIADYPRPQVIYAQPRVIDVLPYKVYPAPMYLRVPPGHYNHWDRYCGHYNACARPVYFVQDRWYNEVYVPRYHGHHDDHDRHHRHKHHGKHKHKHGKGHD
jgi:hypothetical protein